MKKLLLIGVLVLALVAAACGGDGSSDGSKDSSSGGGHDMGSTEGSVMGESAAASEADRTIQVAMLDELAYDPEQLEVSEGEVITFEVVNKGGARHEFVLGDSDYQEMHEDKMADGGQSGMMENGVSVEPGESASLTWRFTESGEVLFGCHEPGHYEGGMVGTIEIG